MKPILITTERGRSCLWIAVSLLVAMLVAVAAHAQSAKLIPAWDASDENSVARIDHGAWQDILNDYLRVHDSGVNRFDYGALKAMQGTSPSLPRTWRLCSRSIRGTIPARNRKRTGSISTTP